MNMKLIVIIIAALMGLYEIALDIVRYRSASNPIPQNVADVYDPDTYLKWKRYSAETCMLSIFSSIASLVVDIVLLITNAFAAFATLFPAGEFWQLTAVIILMVVSGVIVKSIFNYIDTMVIEEKYGFNNSTMKRFILDCIQKLLLQLLLSFLLTGIIVFSHKVMGQWMIVVFAVAIFVFSMAIAFLYPIFSRIGNKFTPLEDGELKDRLLALLSKHGYQVKAIEVMDASTRTTKLNAYFTGFGKLKTIVLYDNLVNALTIDEICAVFAHELGHGLHKDVLMQRIMGVGNYLVMAVAVFLAVNIPSIYTEFGFEALNYGFAYLAFGVFAGLATPLLALASNAYSRYAEYRADRQAVEEGYGEALISALKKLSRENFAHLSPSKINVVLEYSHPSLCSRVDAIEKAIKK